MCFKGLEAFIFMFIKYLIYEHDFGQNPLDT